MKVLLLAVMIFFVIVCVPTKGRAESDRSNSDHAGIVKTVSGEASIVRNGTSAKAQINDHVWGGDQIRTGPDGKIGMIFEDDTIISLGPGTQLVIEDYLFQPAEKRLSFVARILHGTASFLSGQITKLAPDRVRIETPSATVGMRGTHVLIKVD